MKNPKPYAPYIKVRWNDWESRQREKGNCRCNLCAYMAGYFARYYETKVKT